MAISSDRNKRGSNGVGHIHGVPFVEPKTNPETEEAIAAYKAIQPNEGPVDPVHSAEPHLGMSKEDWISLNVRNTQAQVNRVRNESNVSFMMSLSSLVISIVIVAHHFLH